MLTVTGDQPEPSPLQRHFAATYFSLRLGFGIIAVLFPFLLAIGGKVYAGLPLQGSMSAYYHAVLDDRSMSTWFVGFLFALGALLCLYRGFSTRENIVLNVAGIAAVFVAVFPMEWDCGDACARFSIHGLSAIVAFSCIAYVSAFCANETVKLIRDGKRRERLRITYRILAVLMFASPVMAFVLSSLLGTRGSVVFLVEAVGIVVFAVYWFVKGTELRQTQADYIAVEGNLLAS